MSFVLLSSSVRPLAEEHDVALLDLDGVVYVGAKAVPGAPDALGQAREAGMRLAFVTNNAARPPRAVADHLVELGIQARPDEIITSAQAAARYLADRLPGGARVLVVGTTGLVEALRERGLTPVSDATGQVDAVVQGFSPDLDWRLLAEGSIAIRRRVPWVATNLDPTVPSERGRLPGNGSLVAALRLATELEPIVTGKPDPTMHRETLIRSDAKRPIVVGDRLDTDIEGANAVGCPSLLVFSGVTDPADVLTAPGRQRPSYLARDVGGLLERHPEVTVDERGIRCERWVVSGAGTQLLLTMHADRGAGRADADSDARRNDAASGDGDAADLDALRALCVAAWSAADRIKSDDSGHQAEVRVRADSEAGERTLDAFGLT